MTTNAKITFKATKVSEDVRYSEIIITAKADNEIDDITITYKIDYPAHEKLEPLIKYEYSCKHPSLPDHFKFKFQEDGCLEIVGSPEVDELHVIAEHAIAIGDRFNTQQKLLTQGSRDKHNCFSLKIDTLKDINFKGTLEFKNLSVKAKFISNQGVLSTDFLELDLIDGIHNHPDAILLIKQTAKIVSKNNGIINQGELVCDNLAANFSLFSNEEQGTCILETAEFNANIQDNDKYKDISTNFINSGNLSVNTLSGYFANIDLSITSTTYCASKCKLRNYGNLTVAGKFVIEKDIFYDGDNNIQIEQDGIIVSKNRMTLKCKKQAYISGLIGAKAYFNIRPLRGLVNASNGKIATNGYAIIETKYGQLENYGAINSKNSVNLFGKTIICGENSSIIANILSAIRAGGAIINQGDILTNGQSSIETIGTVVNAYGGRIISKSLDFDARELLNQDPEQLVNIELLPMNTESLDNNHLLELVNNKSQALDATIEQAGQVQNHSLIGAHTYMRTNSANVTNSGIMFSYGAIDINAASKISNLMGAYILAYGQIAMHTQATLINAGTILTKAKLNINSSEWLNNLAGGRLEASIIKSISDSLENSGTIAANTLEANAITTIHQYLNGSMEATEALQLISGEVINEGLIRACNKISIDARYLIENQGKINSKQTIALLCGSIIKNAGSIEGIEDIKIHATKLIQELESAEIISKDSLQIIADFAIESAGLISGKKVELSAAEWVKNLSSGCILGDEINVEGDNISNAGNIKAKNLILQAKALIECSKDSLIEVADLIKLTADRIENFGTINCLKKICIDARFLIRNTGAINSNTKIALICASIIENAGEINALSKVKIKAQSLLNNIKNGLINSREDLNILLKFALDNSGLLAGNNVKILSETIRNSGAIEAVNLDLHAQLILENVESGLITAKEAIYLHTNKLINSGTIDCLKNIHADVLEIITNQAAGQFTAGEALTFICASLVENLGTIKGGQNIKITAANILQRCVTGEMLSQGDIELVAKFALENAGIIVGEKIDLLTLEKDSLIKNLNGANIAGSNINIVTTTAENHGIISSAATINLDTKLLLTNFMGGVITAQDLINIKAGKLKNHGLIESAHKIELDVEQLLNLEREGRITAGEFAVITCTSVLENFGEISACNDLIINAKELLQNAFTGKIISNAQLKLIVKDTIVNAGLLSGKCLEATITQVKGIFKNLNEAHIFGQESANIKVATLENGGSIQSDSGTVSIETQALLYNLATGVISARDLINIKAGKITNNGNLQSLANININTETAIDNLEQGKISAGASIAIICASILDNAGDIEAWQDIKVEAANILQAIASGRIVAAKSLELIAEAAIENTGILSGKNAHLQITKTAGWFKNLESAKLIAKQGIEIASPTFENNGEISSSTGNITLREHLVFKNLAQGKILAKNALTILSKDGENLGLLEAHSALLDFSGSFDNKNDIQTTADLSIKARDAICLFQAGKVQAKRALEIIAGQTVFTEADILAYETLSIITASLEHKSGTIQSIEDIKLKLNDWVLNGKIHAKQDLITEIANNWDWQADGEFSAERKVVLGLDKGYTFIRPIIAINDLEINTKNHAPLTFLTDVIAEGNFYLEGGEINIGEEAGVFSKLSSQKGIFSANCVKFDNRHGGIYGHLGFDIHATDAIINGRGVSKQRVEQRSQYVHIRDDYYRKWGCKHTRQIWVWQNYNVTVNYTDTNNSYFMSNGTANLVSDTNSIMNNYANMDFKNAANIKGIGDFQNIGGKIRLGDGSIIDVTNRVINKTEYMTHWLDDTTGHGRALSPQATFEVDGNLEVHAPVANYGGLFKVDGDFTSHRGGMYGESFSEFDHTTSYHSVRGERRHGYGSRKRYMVATTHHNDTKYYLGTFQIGGDINILDENADISVDSVQAAGGINAKCKTFAVIKPFPSNSLSATTNSMMGVSAGAAVNVEGDLHSRMIIEDRISTPSMFSFNGGYFALMGKTMTHYAAIRLDRKAWGVQAIQVLDPTSGILNVGSAHLNAETVAITGEAYTTNGNLEIITNNFIAEANASEQIIHSNCASSIKPVFKPVIIKSSADLNIITKHFLGSGVNFQANGTLEINAEEALDMLLSVISYALPVNKQRKLLSTKVSGGLDYSTLGNYLKANHIVLNSPKAKLQNMAFVGGSPILNIEQLVRETLNFQPELYSYRKINFAAQAAIMFVSWYVPSLTVARFGMNPKLISTIVTKSAMQGAISAALSGENILKSAIKNGTLATFGEFTKNALSSHKYRGLLFKAAAQAAASKVVYGGNFMHGAMGNLITAASGIYAGQANITNIKEAINNAITTGIIAVLHKRKLKDVLQAEILSLIGGRAAALGDAVGKRLLEQAANKKLALATKAKLDKPAGKAQTTTPTIALRAVTNTKTSTPTRFEKELTAALSSSIKEVYSFDSTKDYFDYFLDTQTLNYVEQGTGMRPQESSGLQQRSTIMLFWQYATNQLSPQAKREVRQGIGLGLMEGVRLGRDNIISLLTFSDSAYAAVPTSESETFMFNTSFQYRPNLPKVDLTANISRSLNREFSYLMETNFTSNNFISNPSGFRPGTSADTIFYSNHSTFEVALAAIFKGDRQAQQEMRNRWPGRASCIDTFEPQLAWVATGRAFTNIGEGITQLVLQARVKLNLASQSTLDDYTNKINLDREFYYTTPIGRSLGGKITEFGTEMLIYSTLSFGAGARGAKLLYSSAASGAVIGGLQSVEDGSFNSRFNNAAVGAGLGVVGGSIVPVFHEAKCLHYAYNLHKKGDITHIFSKAKGKLTPRHGHLADTILNRRLIAKTILNEKNFQGISKFGDRWYAKLQTNGKQIWVRVSNKGVIKSGGLNDTPIDLIQKYNLKNVPKNK